MNEVQTVDKAREGFVALEHRTKATLKQFTGSETLNPLDVKTALTGLDGREWEHVRLGCLNTSLETKLSRMQEYLSRSADEFYRAVRVLNYIYALKRGGLLR